MQRYCILSGAIRTGGGRESGIAVSWRFVVLLAPYSLFNHPFPRLLVPLRTVVVRVPRVSLPFVKMSLELNLLPKGTCRPSFPPEYYSLFKKFPLNGFDSEKFYLWIFFYPCYLWKLMIRVDNFIFGISIIQFDTINLRISLQDWSQTSSFINITSKPRTTMNKVFIFFCVEFFVRLAQKLQIRSTR